MILFLLKENFNIKIFIAKFRLSFTISFSALRSQFSFIIYTCKEFYIYYQISLLNHQNISIFNNELDLYRRYFLIMIFKVIFTTIKYFK